MIEDEILDQKVVIDGVDHHYLGIRFICVDKQRPDDYPGENEDVCQNCFETGRFKRLLKKRKSGNKIAGG